MRISKYTIVGQFHILPYIKITHDIWLNGEYELMIGWINIGISLSYKPKTKMSKLKQIKIPVTLGLDNILRVAVEQGVIENEFNWKLVRERDGLTKQSKSTKWIEWNEDRTFKDQFEEIAIGRSLIMSPFNQSFTWQTTTVTEIVEQQEDCIKFKTENSNYELWKLKKD